MRSVAHSVDVVNYRCSFAMSIFTMSLTRLLNRGRSVVRMVPVLDMIFSFLSPNYSKVEPAPKNDSSPTVRTSCRHLIGWGCHGCIGVSMLM